VQEGKAATLKVARQLSAIEEQREAIESGAVTLPDGVFEVIVIDPPWPYGTAEHYNDKGFRGTTPYPEMPMEDLFKLELPSADDCVLWLWTTARFIEEACQLCRAWGFEKKNVLTWDKQEMGVGHWLRQSTELCLFAVKGKPKILRHDVRTLLSARRREHSRKPEEFYGLVESTCIGRRLDYFSRESRPGWEQFGNETAKFRDSA
jgi:N6-adenosine-specific RNA methylase IME4